MSKDKVDPAEGLEDDASEGLEIKDPVKREADQREYYGGDPEEDTDDLSALDRGDLVEDEKKDEDRGDDVSKDGDEDESEEESEGDEEGEEGDEEEGSDSDSEDDDAEEDGAESGDQEGDESAEDGSEDDESADDAVEGEEEEEEEEEEETDTKIPRKRFNEVNTRMRDAEAELARRDALVVAKDDAEEDTYDFDAAEEEYMTLLLDGKTKEAGTKRKEIRTAEMEVFKSESVEETTTAVDAAAMQKTLTGLSKEAEAMFPSFDPKHDDFNSDAVDKVLTFMRGYELRGMPSDDAFVSAVADAMEIYDLVTEGEEQSDGEEAPKKKVVTKKKPIKKVKQKIAASKQQAKSPVGEGEGSSDRGAVAPDIEDMTDEEMDALPAGTLERMRGDVM